MPALGTSLLELIRRTACDLPADVDRALETALKGEEPGTNGESAIEIFLRAANRARGERIPLGGDAAALRFTVDAPPGFDRAAFRAAADAASHAAAEEGVIRTDFVDLPGGRPRRGMQLGAPPVIAFRDIPAQAETGGAVRVSLRIVSYFESGATVQRTIPGPGAPGIPTLDGVVSIVLAAIHEQQGRPAGPGLVGIHIGADPVSGLAAAEGELLRPIDDRNPQRPLAQLESRIAERVNQLGIGPLALGGKTTILGAKVAVDPAPADRWSISIAVSSWALRRQTVTIGPDGAIRSWETALTEEGAAKSVARLAARFAAKRAAEKAAEKAAKAAAAKPPAPPRPATPPSVSRPVSRGLLGNISAALREEQVSRAVRPAKGRARPVEATRKSAPAPSAKAAPRPAGKAPAAPGGAAPASKPKAAVAPKPAPPAAPNNPGRDAASSAAAKPASKPAAKPAGKAESNAGRKSSQPTAPKPPSKSSPKPSPAPAGAAKRPAKPAAAKKPPKAAPAKKNSKKPGKRS